MNIAALFFDAPCRAQLRHLVHGQKTRSHGPHINCARKEVLPMQRGTRCANVAHVAVQKRQEGNTWSTKNCRRGEISNVSREAWILRLACESGSEREQQPARTLHDRSGTQFPHDVAQPLHRIIDLRVAQVGRRANTKRIRAVVCLDAGIVQQSADFSGAGRA